MSIASRRERERRERRLSILDAAHEVFGNKGFDQATMDDIAAAAELSKGTLYLYFKNKDALFMALVVRMTRRNAAEFERLARESKSGLCAIQDMLATYAESITRSPQLFRVMVGQLASGRMIDTETPAFLQHREQVERLVSAFVTAIERGKLDGSLRPGLDARQTSSQLWGGLIGTMLISINSAEMKRRFPQNIDYSRFVEGFIQLVCNGLQPPMTESLEAAL